MDEAMLAYWKGQCDACMKRAGQLKDLEAAVGTALAPVAQVDATLAVAAAIRIHALVLETPLQRIAHKGGPTGLGPQ